MTDDLSKIFNWRSLRSEKTRPHDVRKDPTGRIAVIVQWRGRSRDWPLNVNLRNDAAAAVREGRLTKAYVAQVEGQKVLRSAAVETVIANIGNTAPLDGIYGLYHWLDDNFMPTGGGGWGASDDEPF
jgi:hypothetical protein